MMFLFDLLLLLLLLSIVINGVDNKNTAQAFHVAPSASRMIAHSSSNNNKRSSSSSSSSNNNCQQLMLKMTSSNNNDVNYNSSSTTARSTFADSNSGQNMSIPTIQQLETDPFIDQVKHAEYVVSLLLLSREDVHSNHHHHRHHYPTIEPDLLNQCLKAQLSHPNGIRGFMVTYLTTTTSSSPASSSSPAAEEEESMSSAAAAAAAASAMVPTSLVAAVIEQIDAMQQDANQLVALMCMNVIMPTAMTTLHQDAALAKQSAQTASKATALLRAVLDSCRRRRRDKDKNDELALLLQAKAKMVQTQCRAILAVAQHDEDNAATDNTNINTNIQYWKEFFDNWGYQATQKQDIAAAMRGILEDDE